MRRSHRSISLAAGFAALALVAAGCGGGSNSAATGSTAGKPTVIRFLIAPDPVWDYLQDQGIVEEYEKKYNITIRTSSSWDEFQFFAGGHGDIVSMGTLELPILEKQTGIKTVTFGRYNGFRSTPGALCSKGYKTLADLPKGSKLGVNSPLSSTLLWDIYSRMKYGFPLQVGNPKTPFKIMVEDHFVMPEQVARGDLDAAIMIPEAAAPNLRTNKICWMYDGQPSWKVFAGLLPDSSHKGVLSNGFTSTKKFYDANPKAVQAFLALWERGLKEWNANKEKIVRTYPQHFSVKDEADIKYIVDYLKSEKDYFADSVYLSDKWIKNESTIYDLMKQYGLMAKSDPVPAFAVVKPPTT